MPPGDPYPTINFQSALLNIQLYQKKNREHKYSLSSTQVVKSAITYE